MAVGAGSCLPGVLQPFLFGMLGRDGAQGFCPRCAKQTLPSGVYYSQPPGPLPHETHGRGTTSLKGFGASCLLGAELIDDLFLEKNNTVWV